MVATLSQPTLPLTLNHASPQTRGLVRAWCAWMGGKGVSAGYAGLKDLAGGVDALVDAGPVFSPSPNGVGLYLAGSGTASNDSITGNLEAVADAGSTLVVYMTPNQTIDSGQTLNRYILRTTNDGGATNGDQSILINQTDGTLSWNTRHDGTTWSNFKSVRTSWPSQQMFMAAFVTDKDGRKLYVDGRLENTDANTTQGQNARQQFIMQYYDYTAQFAGWLHEMLFYKRALTPSEVAGLWNPATRFDRWQPRSAYTPHGGVLASAGSASTPGWKGPMRSPVMSSPLKYPVL